MSDASNWQNLWHSILGKCIELLNEFEFNPDAFISAVEKSTDLHSDIQDFLLLIHSNPQRCIDVFSAYLFDANTLLQSQLSDSTHQNAAYRDKRFEAEEWQKMPFFLYLSQHYLLIHKHMTALTEHVDRLDPHTARKVKFFIQQYLDALSPAHFIGTNPQLLAETIESRGINLLRGLKHFLDDIDTRSARWKLSMTDKSAFKVGHNIAITPGKVIYRNELIELIQYTPQTKTVKSTPLLIIPPWINKYYILDLSEHNSLVRWLVAQGITVFLISWRNPDKQHAEMGLAEYVNLGPVAAISAIQTQLQVKSVSALGFCIGGTLLSLVLAYYKAHHIDAICSATFLASLIDFTDPGDISVYMSEKQIMAVEKHMQKQGYLEGAFMASAFNSLRATELIWAFYIRHYLLGQPPAPFDLLYWNSDSTNMPAKMHSEYLRWMYLNNDLVKPGKIVINQTPIDVSTIDVPLFFLSTQKDHIAPWKSTYQGFCLMAGKKRFVLAGSGHIAGIIIPPGKDKYGYYTCTSYPKDPDLWFMKATYSSGSWWPEWLKWLKRQTGKTIKAPDCSELPLQSLADAPGTYVR